MVEWFAFRKFNSFRIFWNFKPFVLGIFGDELTALKTGKTGFEQPFALSKMAANFWLSSHCNQWLLDREEIQLERQRDYQYLKEEDYKKIHIFFINFIQALGEHLKLRQQVIATATLYYKRFYARNSLKSIDSLLMAPTCTYLAHKTEECGVISNNRFTAACNTVVKNKFSFAFPGEQFPYRMSQVSHHLN